MHPTDTTLIEELHRRHAAQVYVTCLRMLGCPSEAEDAVQETFLRAQRALPGLREKAAAAGWLRRIACNVSRNMIRTRRRKGLTPVPDSDDFHAPGSSSVDEIHCRRVLKQLAEELDERSLRILVACYRDGLSQKEIAAQLGLSRRSVVKRLSGLRRRAALLRCA